MRRKYEASCGRIGLQTHFGNQMTKMCKKAVDSFFKDTEQTLK